MTLTDPGHRRRPSPPARPAARRCPRPGPRMRVGQAGAAQPASASVAFQRRRRSSVSSTSGPLRPASTTSGVRCGRARHAARSGIRRRDRRRRRRSRDPSALRTRGDRCRRPCVSGDGSLQAGHSSIPRQLSGQFWTAVHACPVKPFGHLGMQQDAVPLVVAVEELGCQGVATPVARAPVGVQCQPHGRLPYPRRTAVVAAGAPWYPPPMDTSEATGPATVIGVAGR